MVGREARKLLTLAWTCWQQHSVRGGGGGGEAQVPAGAGKNQMPREDWQLSLARTFACWLQQVRAGCSTLETVLTLRQNSDRRATLRACWQRLRAHAELSRTRTQLQEGRERELALRDELLRLRGDHEEGMAQLRREVEAERERADVAEQGLARGNVAARLGASWAGGGTGGSFDYSASGAGAQGAPLPVKPQGEAQVYRSLCVEEAIATAEKDGQARRSELEAIKTQVMAKRVRVRGSEGGGGGGGG